jgi:hypothetical protein
MGVLVKRGLVDKELVLQMFFEQVATAALSTCEKAWQKKATNGAVDGD